MVPANCTPDEALGNLEETVAALRQELTELRTKLEKEGRAMREELAELRAWRKSRGSRG
jgi:ribosomal protein L29